MIRLMQMRKVIAMPIASKVSGEENLTNISFRKTHHQKYPNGT